MARLFAFEWDAREARVVIARTRGLEAVIDAAFSVELFSDDKDVDVGAKLAEVLAKHDVRRADALVALGRANIELRVLSVPSAPDDELPEMVRFEALKQFSSMGERWPIDFVPLDGGGELQSVLAAAISPDLIDQIRATCRAFHAEPKRLVLRPFAAAALWRRQSTDTRCTMMIDMLADEADLTVLSGGHVVFTRTVRLSLGSEEELTKNLVGEIRRTLAAVHNQLAGQRVEQLVFCGDNEAHSALRSQVQTQVGLDVEYFDPFSKLALAGQAAASLPQHPGRYAPLLGLIVNQAAGERPDIDFLNPRQRPAPVSHRRTISVVALAVATMVLAACGWLWSIFSNYDRQIAALKAESKQLDDELKKMKSIGDEVAKIDEFTRSDVNWLDEMYALSSNFLPAGDTVVSKLNFVAAGRQGGGTTTIEGLIRESSLIDRLQEQLRDERRSVSNSGSGFDEKQEVYKWHFTESMVIAPEEPEARFNDREPPPQADPQKDEALAAPSTVAAPGTHAAPDTLADPEQGKATAPADDPLPPTSDDSKSASPEARS